MTVTCNLQLPAVPQQNCARSCSKSESCLWERYLIMVIRSVLGVQARYRFRCVHLINCPIGCISGELHPRTGPATC